MRISTTQIYNLGTHAMVDSQAKLSKTQQQLASGRRILAPSDDPSGSARVLDLKKGIALAEQYIANGVEAERKLTQSESLLGNVGDILIRVKELTIQASNGTQSNTSRSGIAQEIDQLLEETMGMANARDSNGDFIFAGNKVRSVPFSASAGGFVYNGDQGNRQIQIGPSRKVSAGESGDSVFMQIKNGNGTFYTAENAGNTGGGVITDGSVTDFSAWVPDDYTLTFTGPNTYDIVGATTGAVVTGATYTSGDRITFNGVEFSLRGAPDVGDNFTVATSQNKDIFSTLKDLSNALKTNAVTVADKAHVSNSLGRALSELDNAQVNVLEARARFGARQNGVDSQAQINEASRIELMQTASMVEDLDYAEAVSRMQLQMVGLQAAQQSFVKLQNLSLFNYL